MKLNILITSAYLFLFSCKTHEENKKYTTKEAATENIRSLDSKFQGEFSSTVETEETTSGTASITYHFDIKNDIAVLTTKTYHEPIRCNGNYKAVENNGILELFYAGDEESCQSKNSKSSWKTKNITYKVLVEKLLLMNRLN